MYKKDRKRLIVDVDPEIHKLIKATAKFKNISMKKYVLRTLLRKLDRDIKFIEKEVG